MFQKPFEPENCPEAERLLRLMEFLSWRQRTQGILRGLACLAISSLGLLALFIFWDLNFNLAGWKRALLLAAWCAWQAGAFIFLLPPFFRRANSLKNLSISLESTDGQMKDYLASAVHFIQDPASVADTSKEMRTRVVVEAWGKAITQDLDKKVQVRGVGISLMGLGLVCFVCVLLFSKAPGTAFVGMSRFFFPYAATPWPTRTLLSLDPVKEKIGTNESLLVTAKVEGEIPSRGRTTVYKDGKVVASLVSEIQIDPESGVGRMQARLDPMQYPGGFQFQVHAGDAESRLVSVEVLDPPSFIPDEGKPTPNGKVYHPLYTRLEPEQELSAGISRVDLPYGSRVFLQARVNRPLETVRLEILPEFKELPGAIAAALYSSNQPLETAVLSAMAVETLAAKTALLDPAKDRLSIRFHPLASGIYSLVAEDANHLYATRQFEIHLHLDPAPQVKLISQLSLSGGIPLLPGAAIDLEAQAEDSQFGIRSVWVESAAGAREKSLKKEELFLENKGVVPPRGEKATTSTQASKHIDLKEIKKAGGESLKAGDRVLVRFAADDFDDVLPLKPAGASDWVEIRVVDRNDLDLVMGKEQDKIRKEILKVREAQIKASGQTREAGKKMQESDGDPAQAFDELRKAAQTQRDVRERVGEPKNGVRKEIDNLRKLSEWNKLRSSDASDELKGLAKKLENLAEGPLAKVEPQLGDASKRLEKMEVGKKEEAAEVKKSMAMARVTQAEIEKSLDEILKGLEPWAGLQELRNESRAALSKQEDLKRKVEDLRREDPLAAGKQPSELTPMQKDKLEEIAREQKNLAEKTGELMEKLDRSARNRAGFDKDMKEKISAALEEKSVQETPGAMRKASKEIESNQLAEAGEKQSRAAEGMKDLLEKMEDQSKQRSEKLAKKLREIEKEIEKAKDDLERLKKKEKETAALKNAQEKAQARQAQAQEMNRLANKLEEMAQTLSRMNDVEAGEELEEAAAQLKKDAQALTRGMEPKEQDIEEKLQRELQEVRRAAKRMEDRLQREKLEQAADLMRQILERQKALLLESQRLDLLLKEKGLWSRGQVISIGSMTGAQAGLASETRSIASRELTELPVFLKVISLAVAAMEEAAKTGERNPRTGLRGPPLAELTIPKQQEALTRLTQFQDALHEEIARMENQERRQAERDRNGNTGEGGEGGMEGGAGMDGQNRGLASLAQLKLLRNLQADLHQRTQAHGAKYPQGARVPEAVRKEMLQLQKDQREIGELLELLLGEAGKNPLENNP